MTESSCSITSSTLNGWTAVTLGNSLIEVTVLPEKGADIYRFIDVASRIDVLGKTPSGLLPPHSPPRDGRVGFEFLDNYEGAWQELFPNTLMPCTNLGRTIPMHGEVATLPWTVQLERESAEEVRIVLSVRCRQLPLTLTRSMSLSAHSSTLLIDEEVRNTSDDRVAFVWGHHPLLGPPFLDAGCRIDSNACTVHTLAPAELATATFAPGQRSHWPYVKHVDGGNIDLRMIADANAGTHDHAYLTDLERGWIEVENPRLRLAFALEWDPGVFRWLINWRPFGGSHQPPLEGIYGMAIEPWASQSNLVAAIETGDALALDGRKSLRTWLRATLRATQADH